MFLDTAKTIMLYPTQFDCAGLIQASEDLGLWKTAKVDNSDGSYAAVTDFRNNSRIYIKEFGTNGISWDRKLFLAFNLALSEYLKHFFFPSNRVKDEGYEILKYNPGEYFKLHIDDGANWQNHRRTVSAIFFLNDNFGGGEIEFPRQQIKIKPKAGSIIIFPSNFAYPHQVLPPDGVRYVAVTWFN